MITRKTTLPSLDHPDLGATRNHYQHYDKYTGSLDHPDLGATRNHDGSLNKAHFSLDHPDLGATRNPANVFPFHPLELRSSGLGRNPQPARHGGAS